MGDTASWVGQPWWQPPVSPSLPPSGLRIGQGGAGTRCVPLTWYPVYRQRPGAQVCSAEKEHSSTQRQAQSPNPPVPLASARAALPALQPGLCVHTCTRIHLHKDTHCTHSQANSSQHPWFPGREAKSQCAGTMALFLQA